MVTCKNIVRYILFLLALKAQHKFTDNVPHDFLPNCEVSFIPVQSRIAFQNLPCCVLFSVPLHVFLSYYSVSPSFSNNATMTSNQQHKFNQISIFSFCITGLVTMVVRRGCMGGHFPPWILKYFSSFRCW